MKILKEQFAEFEIAGHQVSVHLVYDPPVKENHQLPQIRITVDLKKEFEGTRILNTTDVFDVLDAHMKAEVKYKIQDEYGRE